MTDFETEPCKWCKRPIVFSPTNPKKTYAFKMRMFGRKTFYFCTWSCMKDYECSPLYGRDWHPGCVKVKDFWLREKSPVALWAKSHHGTAERLAKDCETADQFRRKVAHNVKHICISCFQLIDSTSIAAGNRTCVRCRARLRRLGAKNYARKKEAERLAKLREAARNDG